MLPGEAYFTKAVGIHFYGMSSYHAYDCHDCVVESKETESNRIQWLINQRLANCISQMKRILTISTFIKGKATESR